jgi:hypothetical protein
MKKYVLALLVTAWALSIAIGMGVLLRYKNTPGVASEPPPNWPHASAIVPAAGISTLVMIAHPRCPCTRASIGELARLMTETQDRINAYVVFVKPAGVSADFTATDTYERAKEIAGVTVLIDEGGVEAERFHASTSGDTIVYGADGKLMFHGGITASRGHFGDSAGQRRIRSLVSDGTADRGDAPVFGCSVTGSP